MSQLPSELPATLKHLKLAYDVCVRLESEVQSDISDIYKNKDRQCRERDLIFCRILGYLLHHAPSNVAREHVYNEIIVFKDDSCKLLEVGQRYFDNYIWILFYDNGCYTSTFSPSPSPSLSPFPSPSSSTHEFIPSFNNPKDKVNWLLRKLPEGYKKAELLARMRDEPRCVLSGAYDIITVCHNAKLKELSKSSDISPSIVKITHILPEIGYATPFHSVIVNFGYGHIVEELNGLGVHRLENILSLGSTVHHLFNNMIVYLTPTETRNQYKIETIDDIFLPMFPAEYVTFQSSDPARLLLPSVDYLAIHGSCAKVAHLSGATRYMINLEKIDEELAVYLEAA